MKKIKRKTMLYKTGVEYGDYTLNHVQGCFHGCKFPCYAMQMAKRFGKIKCYEEWIEPYIVENTLELLDLELPKLSKRIKFVHMCFTTDPFMSGFPEVEEMSLSIISKINSYNIPVEILTKGILPFKLKQISNNRDNVFGITLVSLSEKFREKYEPGASLYNDRIKSLRECHDNGMKTWVSIEPYPTPNICEQSLVDLLEAISFVDYIVFGRWNYNKEVGSYKNCKVFYNEQSKIVETFCLKRGIKLHIKEGTRMIGESDR
ncbi:MAG: radical SAM protein [Erysipelotrichaceae bacterium]